MFSIKTCQIILNFRTGGCFISIIKGIILAATIVSVGCLLGLLIFYTTRQAYKVQIFYDVHYLPHSFQFILISNTDLSRKIHPGIYYRTTAMAPKFTQIVKEYSTQKLSSSHPTDIQCGRTTIFI